MTRAIMRKLSIFKKETDIHNSDSHCSVAENVAQLHGTGTVIMITILRKVSW